MKKLVIASHNEGKVREIRELLSAVGVEVVSAAGAGLPEPEETGKTFAENATIKSESAATLSGEYALSDDSGLCVPALDDAPGIYSARWAGKDKDFSMAMQRIHDELKQKKLEPTGQAAYFICVLALTSPQGKTEIFEGRIDGQLTFPPRGKSGFGYDPIFVPEGYSQTFGEMDSSAKHSMSHRARAFEKFLKRFT
jgi:XTP/dITP diphosphohydrolase